MDTINSIIICHHQKKKGGGGEGAKGERGSPEFVYISELYCSCIVVKRCIKNDSCIILRWEGEGEREGTKFSFSKQLLVF